jgi:hypothetical protein
MLPVILDQRLARRGAATMTAYAANARRTAAASICSACSVNPEPLIERDARFHRNWCRARADR